MQIMNTDQLIDYCKTLSWTRDIKQLHVHHTWKPNHSDYNGKNGLQLQQSMKDYHTKTNGWSDIGQHLTLLPDGQWVTGRDFNKDPASISGWNAGAFAIEMLGNFDTGHDKFGLKQAQEMFKFCAFFVQFCGLLINEAVKFHRDSPTAGKTCPGTGIDRAWFMNEIKNAIKEVKFMNADQAIDKLVESGVINSPDYWRTAVKVVKSLDALLIKFAERMDEK